MTTSGRFRFNEYELDEPERQLRRGGEPLDLNARYFDALTLLVRERGRLVSKDRFMAEVWRGVPVTDEALTQCIRSLRRLLGDDAARPRFIETVPRHGYRFIAAVADGEEAAAPPPAGRSGADLRPVLLLGLAGTAGGAAAGLLGGLFYGFAAAAAQGPAGGAASALIVLLGITLLLALIAGAAVSFGIAAAAARAGRLDGSAVIGGALGGLAVGAVVKLLGLDALGLLFGRAPASITGAFEGVLLGGAVGIGAWLAGRLSLRRSAAAACLAGGLAGLLIALAGGRLLGGSLDLLVRHFPGSRLRFDAIGALFGESGFGFLSQAITAALEGALFAGCVVAAMKLAQSRFGNGRRPG